MKKSVRYLLGSASVSAIAALALLGASPSQAGSGPPPTPQSPFTADSTEAALHAKPLRLINGQFTRAALAVVDAYGDRSLFDCLEFTPYERALPQNCEGFNHSEFDQWRVENGEQRYGLNAKSILQPEDRARLFPGKWNDVFQVFLAAHEFKHYLNFKINYHVLGQEGFENEFLADLYGLSVVKSLYPAEFPAFLDKVVQWRQDWRYRDAMHSGIAQYDLKPEDFHAVKINTMDDLYAISGKANGLFERIRHPEPGRQYAQINYDTSSAHPVAAVFRPRPSQHR